MTPLAAYLTKQILARPKHREHIWVEPENLGHLRETLSGVHCFEVTGAIPLLKELADSFRMDDEARARTERLFRTFAFLPAPKTWIEWIHGSGKRIGIHLEDHGNSAACTLFTHEMATNLGALSTISGDYYDYGGLRHFPRFLTDLGGEKTAAAMLGFAHSMLLLINSPKIIGRRQHMPNAGLEAKLTKGLGVGRFPLHAWTEIILQVSKPPEIDDGEPHEAHLTGRRALHFCRKHIRIRLGKLEYVSAHWRGDPALGIKRSRYTVTP